MTKTVSRRLWYATVATRPDQSGGGRVFPTLREARNHVRAACKRSPRDIPAGVEVYKTLYAAVLAATGGREAEERAVRSLRKMADQNHPVVRAVLGLPGSPLPAKRNP